MPQLSKTTLVVVLWLSCAINTRADITENPIILGLRIEGTRRPLDIETRIGEELDRERIARDFRRLWATGWFDDIRVELSRPASLTTFGANGECIYSVVSIGGESGQRPSEGERVATQDPVARESCGVFVVFKLVERPRYLLRRVRFHPASRQYPAEISAGTLIDKRLAHQTAAKLQEKLVDEGYHDATIRTQIVPVDSRQADLDVWVQPGPRYQVHHVRFSGNLGLSEEELQQALHQTRTRGALPGLGNFWKRWESPPFSQRLVEADLEVLRSFYFSLGYWDNVIQVQTIEFDENEAAVTIAVESGRRYTTSSTEIAGDATKTETISPSDSDSSTESLCHCLRRAQRKAERAGNLDFAVHLEVRSLGKRDSPESATQPEQTLDRGPQASLRARLEPGPSYKIGRIDFQGNHSFGDLTLRRALLLNEGEPFDYSKLRGSLSRLNQMGFFEILTQDQVRMVRDPATNQVGLTLELKEKPRGR
jgi:outer membrane protein assembly factor BamA